MTTVDLSELSPIQRPESLADLAYTTLRASIRTGKLEPETLYSEVQIANRLRISRTPVREALIELSRQGIVEILPQRGFRLRRISAEEQREVFDLRTLIEVYAARRLAEVASGEHVELLRRILVRQEGAVDDVERFIETDEEFHIAIPSLLHLERSREGLLALRGIMWISAAGVTRLDRTPAILAQHIEILERIAAHDADGAEASIRAHIEHTRRAVVSREPEGG
jgi:DNA-binding GntR family transcriptional regulator